LFHFSSFLQRIINFIDYITSRGLFRLAEYRPAHFSDECDKPACRQAGKTNSSGLVPEYRVSLSADKAGLLRGSLFQESKNFLTFHF